jgi:glutamine amidotransferase
VSANRSQTFIADAREVRSTTFLAHIRHATAAQPTLENTHPFVQHGRVFAHNGVLADLDDLRGRLGSHAELLQGETDSELYFTLMTKRIEEADGDIGAGITAAARELAAEIELYSLNMLLTTPTDIWALRYPDTNELWVMERTLAGFDDGAMFDKRSNAGITRVFSGELAILPATVIASQRMDSNPTWRLMESGELIHVDSKLNVTSTIAIPDAPAKLMELTAHVAATQEEEPGYTAASPEST